MQPTEELYYKYAGVITSVVNKYARKCPDVEEELFLQAQLVFCQACLSYDPNHPSKASFETWLRNQLKSITSVINKATHGPSLLKSTNASAVTVSMLAQNISREEDEDPTDISDVATKWFIEEYGDNLSNGTNNGDYPSEMKPYIEALTGDSLRVFQDFCKGKFELKPQKFMTIAKRRAREVLNPIRLYRRLYRKEGWSLERVRNAWRGLRGIFSSYTSGKLPVMFCNPKFAQARPKKRQPRKESRCSNWYFGFEKQHGITYGTYRSLVKRGIIPRLGKDDNDTDLSMYAVPAY